MGKVDTRSSFEICLGPSILNHYLNDLFYLAESTEVCNFPEDTTFFASDKDLKNLISRLKHDSQLAIEWFESNNMKLNQGKFCYEVICHNVVFFNTCRNLK